MEQSSRHDQLRTILIFTSAVAVVRLWVMPLNNSFWLDETIIARAIRDTFERTLREAFLTLQSVAFVGLEWLVAHILGTSETALRVLSLVSGIGTLYVYWRIGAEFLDAEAGFSFAAIYLMLPQVAYEVPDARPYAIAMLVEAAAVLWLLRWVRDGSFWQAILWMFCAVVAAHLHYLFLIALPMEVIFIAVRRLMGAPVRWSQLVVCCLIGAVVLIPGVPQLSMLSQQASLLSSAQQPTFLALLGGLAPACILAALLLSTILEWAEGKHPHWLAPVGSEVAVLGGLLLSPVLVLFVLSRFTSVQLFESRYLLPTIPGMVLLWGWLIRGLESPFVRHMSVTAGMLIAIFFIGGLSAVPDYRQEDWRSAVQNMPQNGAVLAYSGLVETRRLDWLQQPEHWRYLMAPVLAYRPAVVQRDAYLVPFDFSQNDQDYVRRQIAGPLGNRDQITVITRRAFWGPEWDSWISHRLVNAGFHQLSSKEYKRVQMVVFQR